jgi:hypothetical protein
VRIQEGLPAWLSRPAPQQDQKTRVKYERTKRYFLAMLNATPKWLTREQKKAFYAVYREMRRRRRNGEAVSVDHVVPLLSDSVCGLNVPWNLEIVDEKQNGRKGNNWWPGCWHENLELALPAPTPYQRKLI